MKNTNAPKPRKCYTLVTPEKRDEIIAYWKANHDNRTPVLAEKFGFSIDAINKVIDKYLAPKQPL